MELFFDTETSGLVIKNAPFWDDRQPFCVQLGLAFGDKDRIYHSLSTIIDAEGRFIEPKAINAHGISAELSEQLGINEKLAVDYFIELAKQADLLIAHNYAFDKVVMQNVICKYYDKDVAKEVFKKESVCTMERTTDILKIKTSWGFKWPKLEELHEYLFLEGFEGAHDALNDVYATRRCYYELIHRGLL